MDPWGAIIGAARAPAPPSPAGFLYSRRAGSLVRLSGATASPPSSARPVAGRGRLCHNRRLGRRTQGGIDGERSDAKQQRSQKAKVGQAKELGVRLQEVARRDRPGVESARQEILS